MVWAKYSLMGLQITQSRSYLCTLGPKVGTIYVLQVLGGGVGWVIGPSGSNLGSEARRGALGSVHARCGPGRRSRLSGL